MIVFKFVEHTIVPHKQVIEMWSNNQMVGQITASDKLGIRIISKYQLLPVEIPNERATPVNIVEVRIG